jgi:hypothetical protein
VTAATSGTSFGVRPKSRGRSPALVLQAVLKILPGEGRTVALLVALIRRSFLPALVSNFCHCCTSSWASSPDRISLTGLGESFLAILA